jgi:hypothetical protein
MPSAPPRGSAIDVFNFSGGRYRTYRQYPSGVRHQRLQLRWWPLSDMLPAPPRGLSSMSSTSMVATAGPVANTPQGARRRRFLALMVGAPGSPALAPPRSPSSMFLSVGGGHSQIFSSNWPYLSVRSLSQGGSGASVGTLKTRYPHIQALSQDKE